MMTNLQATVLKSPLVGREGDRPHFWDEPPWTIGLSFNR